MESIYSDDLDSMNDLSSSLVDTSHLADYLPKKSLRRIDHFSRVALLGAGKAIKDTHPLLFSRETAGVILATGFGALETTFSFLDSYIEKGDKFASPTHFSNSVHNAAAAHVSICYGITGPNLTVSQFDMSFFSALITAGAWLETEKVDAVLIGTSDTFCDVLRYCVQEFSKGKGRQGYSFGEGAAFFLITRQEEKPKYGYFEDISIGNYKHDGLDILQDAVLILSPSSVNACNDDFMNHLKHHDNALYRNRLFSPTDCGMDVFFSTTLKKKICYVKIGQGGEYGKMIIAPGLK